MNHLINAEILTIVERYVPAHHFNERRHLHQDLLHLAERCLFDGGREAWVKSAKRPVWKRIWAALWNEL